MLLSYENEAIEARQAGADFDYIVPPQTLLIQNPAVLTKTASSAAKKFLAFQLSKAGQTDYAEQGFRPLDPSIKVDVKGANDPSNPFPAPGDAADDRQGLRWLVRGQHEVLRREDRHRHQAAIAASGKG